MFAPILLTIPTALLACSPLPAGQEVRVNFQVSGLTTLPTQFAYSDDQANWPTKYPNFAPDSATALKNVKQYIKKSLMQALRQEAKKAGLQSLPPEVGKQIKPTIYYTPMLCNEAAETGATYNDTTNGYYCIASQDTIKNVQYAVNSPQEIPPQYQMFIVNLA
ncbi:hypothetical protein OESDEN_16345, partial [Oesophagostomum dentatum]